MTESTPQPAKATEDLPLRSSSSIQGNILAPFAKDHAAFLLYAFDPTQVDGARQWLGELAPRIATTLQVTTFNDQFSKARRARGGDDPTHLKAVWTGVSFTPSGLRQLAPANSSDLDPFASFVAGSAQQAAALNDVDDSAPAQWLFGGPNNRPVDACVTVAADEEADLRLELERHMKLASKHGLSLVFQIDGSTLTQGRRGHEHFGFKDGISQPGVQGYTPSVTRHGRLEDEAHPGSESLPAGLFVLGLSGGEDLQPPPAVVPSPYGPPGQENHPLPNWLINGSFQVLRRLQQDVPGWWAQVEQGASALVAQGSSTAPDALAAKLVGRWRSGTPTAHAPDRDNRSTRAAGSDNDFTYSNDPEGVNTPRFAHVRKVYPRDEQFADDRHRMLRRGIPFGAPFDPASGRGHGVDADRGLVFSAFVASIENQFEFVQQQWANAANFQPGHDPADGADPVIGLDQGTQSATLHQADGATHSLDFRRFVRTTGSLYLFAPSLETLAMLASGQL